LLKNSIRQLAPGVLEEQIITQQTSWDPKTGQAHSGYGESVIRFTARNPQQMYVQAASVNYSASKRFQMKMVFGGWVTKGQVTNTDPMSAMGGMGGMGGIGEIQKMLGQPGAKGGATPQIPGFDPNMLKNMFGQ
jgi:hypothetical protein